VRICLLGPIEITHAGQEIRLSSQLQRALIAALASEAGWVISAERLIETLWGDQPPSTARVKLQGHVSNLRKMLDCAGSGEVGLNWPLITRKPGYLLSADGVDIDLFDYRALLKLAAGKIVTDEIADASDHLEDALALWHGPAFADARTPIVTSMAAVLESGRLLAIERKAECDLRLGRHETVVEQLTPILTTYPLREGARASLMLALYRRGCRADALACYRTGQRLSREQLGIEPGQLLQRLHELMLTDDPQLAVAGPATFSGDARPVPGEHGRQGVSER
jgi:DNA-binding SARP family transcriptional activator